MSSFIFSDCPTTLALSDGDRDGKKIATGSLALTVRNATTRGLVGTIGVQPDDMAQSGWFKIAGAAPTSPAKRDIECEANATQTVKVDVAVPENAPPGRKVFSLRIATERDPDNDFADSPAVAFEVKAPAPKVEPKKSFPWWIAAVAAVAVIAVGTVVWLMIPSATMPEGLVGAQLDDAIETLVRSKLDLQIDTAQQNVAGKNNLTVLAVSPGENQPVKKGSKVVLTYNLTGTPPASSGRCEHVPAPDRFRCLHIWRSIVLPGIGAPVVR